MRIHRGYVKKRGKIYTPGLPFKTRDNDKPKTLKAYIFYVTFLINLTPDKQLESPGISIIGLVIERWQFRIQDLKVVVGLFPYFSALFCVPIFLIEAQSESPIAASWLKFYTFTSSILK